MDRQPFELECAPVDTCGSWLDTDRPAELTEWLRTMPTGAVAAKLDPCPARQAVVMPGKTHPISTLQPADC
jgi:hypothetical protein